MRRSSGSCRSRIAQTKQNRSRGRGETPGLFLCVLGVRVHPLLCLAYSQMRCLPYQFSRREIFLILYEKFNKNSTPLQKVELFFITIANAEIEKFSIHADL